VKKRIKSVFHILEYIGVVVVYYMISLIPFRLCVHIASAFSTPVSLFFPVREKIIRKNLDLAFPEMKRARRRRILRQSYRNFLLFLVEFIHFRKSGQKNLSRHITRIEGGEYFQKLQPGSNPFFIVTGHMGNWELMGGHFALKGIKLSVLAKPVHNPYVDRMVNKSRKEMGMEIISTRKAPIKSILKAIKQGRQVAFLADQDARRSGIFVDFFGKPASTFTGPALFSIRTGLPLLPAFDIRTGILTHKVIFFPPLYPREDMKRDDAIRELTQRHVRILERVIREYPEQYFWFHRRWKTRPREKIKKSAVV